MARKKKKLLYDCSQCPAYCCSYDRIEVTDRDLKRLAEHFGVSEKKAEKKYTKFWEEDERVLRHRNDEIYGSVCRFLDDETRRCTIYAARPAVCREYPDGRRCGYYDFLKFEREFQDDDEFIPLYD
ncbi:MAG: YkgJ family cysteine cluster protein [Thermoanaerobaculia bacterium]|nr:YkgJ family cysteine cluster protein [Thermoanaerobaculia bacterium]